MKFSIIIPVYNAEVFLEETVESVLKQTYAGFEILLVDDGSTDRSGNICDTLAVTYPNQVQAIHTQNQGAGMARVTGVNNATGDVLLFIDADDCLRHDALTQLKHQFESYECDLIIFNASRKSDFSTSFFDFSTIGGQVLAGTEKKKLYERMVTTRDLNPMWQKAVRKYVALSAVQDTDGLCIKNGEDLLMSMPMLTLAEKIVILDENLYYYRDNSCSAVHKVRLSRVEAVKIVHNKMFHYIDLWDLPELHRKQYARMVMSWMTLVSMVMMSGKELESDRKKKIIRSLAEDPFFTKAYREMEIDLLSKKDVIIAKWLYNKQFIWLWLAYAAKKLTS